MATVRIAHAEPRPGNLGNGIFITNGFLVVLADDAARRALPVFLRGQSGGASLSQLLDRPADAIAARGAPEELAARLLQAVGAGVTGVDVDVTAADTDELDPDALTTRIELGGPAGPGQVAAPFGLGLAVAAATGAPVRVPDLVMDRWSVPVPGDDLLGPLLERLPPGARLTGGRLGGWLARLPVRRPRYEPRNLAFTDGLAWWDLDARFGPDYTCAAEGQSAVLVATVPEPRGSAALVQAIFADDYRGATVTFRGEVRTARLSYEAGLRLDVLRTFLRTRDDHGVTVGGGSDWAPHEVTTRIPEDAELIRFGITLGGPGEVALRHPELARA